MDAYNFPEKCKSIVYDLPLDQVHSLGIEEESAMDSGVNNSVNNSSTTDSIDLNGGSTDAPIGGESSTAASTEGSCIDTPTRPSQLEAPSNDGSTREKGSIEDDSTNGADSSRASDKQVSYHSGHHSFASGWVWHILQELRPRNSIFLVVANFC